jgi:catecholate siderophore receptor
VLDVNIPMPALGSGAAFRLTGMGTIAGVAGRNVATNRRDGFAPSLAFGLGSSTRVTLSYFHQNASDTPDYGLPWLFNAPAPVNRANYYGMRNSNYLRTNDDIATARVEHDFNSHVTLRNQVRYANYFRDVLVTEGALTGVTPSTPLSAIQVTRRQIAARSTETFLDDQLDLSAHFNTGLIRHELVTGVEGGRETSAPTRPTYTAPSTSLLNPNPDQTIFPGYTIASRVKDAALSASAYAIDTIKPEKHWLITGGVRFDRFDNIYKQFVAPASNLNRIDQKATWRAAVVYKPVDRGSLYFDIGTSFNPSAETLSLTNAALANLPPETNKTYEFGTKWELGQKRLTVNAAWFRTVKENARESSPTNSLLYVLAGNQRVSGVQVDVRGHITSRWDMVSSYAYLDSRVVSSQFYPGAIGYPLANVPKNTFSYWNEYRLPYHFEIGAGANYVSNRNSSSTVPLDPTTGLVKQVPGYWVFNAMGSKPINDHLDIQVNVFNIANRYYYDQVHPAHVIPGPGRSALIGFKFRF